MKKFTLTLFYLSIIYLSSNLAVFSQNDCDIVEQNLGEWQIDGGFILKNETPYNLTAGRIWMHFYDFFPKDITRRYIKKLVLMTDGENEKTGALGTLDYYNRKWELVVDTVDVNFRSKDKGRLYQSVYTMVHEFGHLLTLNGSQVRPTDKVEQDEFGSYITNEGEAYERSYLNMFVTLFWNGNLLEKWDNIRSKYCHTESTNCLKKLYGLYRANADEFVTDYAAESPEEDIAESWTAFVLRDRVKKPKTTFEKKINFFYRFPELVEYRKYIRRNIKKFVDL